MSQSEIQQAGELAEQLGAQVREANGDLSAVYTALEEAVVAYREGGGNLELIVPGTYEASLGFRRSRPKGESIWAAYADVLHDELCKPRGTLYKQVQTGLIATGATLVTLIMTTLGLPSGATVIVAPIAGSILGLGVKAFCKSTE